MIDPKPRTQVTRRVVMTPRLEALRAECDFAKQVGGQRGFGNRLTEILHRYDLLIRHYSPAADFTAYEWQNLCDVLWQNWPSHDTAVTPAYLDSMLEQADASKTIRQRIKELSLVQAVALLEAVYHTILEQAVEAHQEDAAAFAIATKTGTVVTVRDHGDAFIQPDEPLGAAQLYVTPAVIKRARLRRLAVGARVRFQELPSKVEGRAGRAGDLVLIETNTNGNR